jgi:hypothetical protein
MSFANHMSDSLRQELLTAELDDRVRRELSEPFHPVAKHAPRPICLLGGYYAVGGDLTSCPQIDWSSDPTATRLLTPLDHGGVPGEIGMYELQFWTGLMALATFQAAPPNLDPARAESFLVRLSTAPAPTPAAESLKQKLLSWLGLARALGWRVPSASHGV